MERVELHAAVARALLPGLNGGRGPSGTPEEGADALARAAIGVVLAEATRSVEMIPGQGWADAAGAGEDMRQAVLVVLAELVPQPPV